MLRATATACRRQQNAINANIMTPPSPSSHPLPTTTTKQSTNDQNTLYIQTQDLAARAVDAVKGRAALGDVVDAVLEHEMGLLNSLVRSDFDLFGTALFEYAGIQMSVRGAGGGVMGGAFPNPSPTHSPFTQPSLFNQQRQQQ